MKRGMFDTPVHDKSDLVDCRYFKPQLSKGFRTVLEISCVGKSKNIKVFFADPESASCPRRCYSICFFLDFSLLPVTTRFASNGGWLASASNFFPGSFAGCEAEQPPRHAALLASASRRLLLRRSLCVAS
jgi:hypothetical protein